MKPHRTPTRILLALTLAALGAWSLPSPAHAQENLQVQQFLPMPGQQSNYFHTARAATPDGGTWELGFVLNYARNPLVIQTALLGDPVERSGVMVSDHLVLDLNAAVSFTRWLELGIALPIYLYDNGETGQGFGRFELPGTPNPGLGDLRLVPRVQLAEWGGSDDEKYALGLMVGILLPTHTNDLAYQGEDVVRLEPRLAFDAWFADWVVWSINGGIVVRPEEVSIENLSAGQTITYGTAASFGVTQNDTLYVVPEIVGAVSIARGDNVDLEEVPFEMRAASQCWLR